MKVYPTFINFDALEGQIMGPYLPLPMEISKRWEVAADAEGVAVFRGVPQHSRLRLDVDDESVAQLGFRSGVALGGDAVIRTAAVQLEAGCVIEGKVTYAGERESGSGCYPFAYRDDQQWVEYRGYRRAFDNG